MAADDTAALVVALSAQLSKFEKDMDKAVGSGDRAVRRIEDRFSKMNPGTDFIDAFGGKIAKLASAAGIAALIGQIHALNEEVAKVADGAERVGTSTEWFQQFRYAVVATGGSIEVADGFLDTFSRKVAEAAQGSGDLYNFLRVNNIEATNFVKLPLNQQVERYADLVKNTTNAQQRMNEAFMVAGRQAGPQIVSALALGGQGLRNLASEAQNAGVIVDKEVIDRAKRINTEYQKLKLTFTTNAQELAVGTWDLLARSFNNVAGGIKEIIDNVDALKKLREGGGTFQGGNIPGVGGDASGVGFIPDSFPGRAPTRITVPGPQRVNVPLPTVRPNVEARESETVQFNQQSESFKKLIEAQEHRIQLLNAERDTIGLNVGAEAELKTKIDLENDAKRQNIPLTEQRRAAIDAEAKKVGQAAQAVDDYKRHWQGINSAIQFSGEQIIDVIDGLRNRTLNASQAVRQLANSFITAAEKALLLGSGPLAGLFGTAPTVAGGTGGLLGTLFGKRAEGGPVTAGQPYIVGEKRPELFVPNTSGFILPSVPKGGSGATVVSVQSVNHFSQGVTPTDMAAISAMVDQKDQRVKTDLIRDIRTGNRTDSTFLNRA